MVCHPSELMDYHYSVKAEALGIRHFPSLALRFNGSCPYNWLHRNEEYDECNLERAANENTVGDLSGRLGFFTFTHPEIDTDAPLVNRSFAFAVTTLQVRCFSPSSDPWYYTDATPNVSDMGAPYIIQSVRPILDCEKTRDVCLGNFCWDTSFSSRDVGVQSPSPEGLRYVITTRFRHPMSVHTTISTGLATLNPTSAPSTG
jgi:hypothetical protein